MGQFKKYSCAVAAGAVFLLAMVMLLVNALYMQRVEELSLFLPVASFFSYCMEMPGGLLTWCATFLTQLFFYPWLGALAFAMLCGLLTWLTARAFGLRGILSLMAVVPASMALLSLLSLGYVIFSLKSPGFAFTTLLGLIAVTAALWGYRSIRIAWVRLLVMLAVVVAGYSAFGAYALFAALLCCIDEAYHIKQSKVLPVATIILGLAAVAVWPRLWFAWVSGRLMITDMYTAILPRLHDDELALWLPYVVTALYMLFLSAVRVDAFAQRHQRLMAVLSPSVAVVSMLCVVLFSYDDPNFRTSIAMQRAINEQDWTKALDIAAANGVEPTRLNCMLTEVALRHTGQVGDRLFAYPVGDADYVTSRSSRALHDAAAPLLCYHFGQVNLAYRWAMEMKVEHDTRVEYLKILAKCALLNGEYDLARKYLTSLSMTMFHRSWAEKYLAYADNPELIAQDSEMALLRRLMCFDDRLGVDSGGFELYMRPMMSRTTPHNEDMLNLAMQNALMSKDLNTFAHWLPLYLRLGKPLPRHYQEAVLMWCYVNDSEAYKQINLDPSVISAFGQFVDAYQRCQRMSPQEQAEYMRNGFGTTFWYYFAILDDLKAI